jgi:hypothetical protein
MFSRKMFWTVIYPILMINVIVLTLDVYFLAHR